MKKIKFIVIAVLLAGCFSAKLVTPTQSDVDRVTAKFSDYSLVELNNGKMLYEKNCGTCHGLKSPTSETEENWKKIVPSMSKKVNKKSIVLDDKAQESILRYLITMSTVK